ncbi:MAG: tRNA-dihydrouridine synthase, partial [Clostridia bacterium]|nr:tRNA-dihydrouridine synthase [Clostridia bacterium]
GIYAHPVLPISVKTRIGYSDIAEWPVLYEIYEQYPISELIVHPRTRQEFYSGTPHREACGLMQKSFIYNGDLFTAAEARKLPADFLRISGVMMGRGLAGNPALAQELAGGDGLTLDALRGFHDDLYREYLRFWPESAVVGRMHLTMKYLCGCFENSEPYRRALRKVKTAKEYENVVSGLFRACSLKLQPAFDLSILLS